MTTRWKVGDRVRITQPVERFPDFVAAPGLGTIREITEDSIWVLYDEHVPGAEDWDNLIQFPFDTDPLDECAELIEVEGGR